MILVVLAFFSSFVAGPSELGRAFEKHAEETHRDARYDPCSLLSSGDTPWKNIIDDHRSFCEITVHGTRPLSIRFIIVLLHAPVYRRTRACTQPRCLAHIDKSNFLLETACTGWGRIDRNLQFDTGESSHLFQAFVPFFPPFFFYRYTRGALCFTLFFFLLPWILSFLYNWDN